MADTSPAESFVQTISDNDTFVKSAQVGDFVDGSSHAIGDHPKTLYRSHGFPRNPLQSYDHYVLRRDVQYNSADRRIRIYKPAFARR